MPPERSQPPAPGSGVDRVAVGCFEDHLEALSLEVVDDLVEPAEVERARLRLALGPAGLETHGLDAERLDQVAVFPEVGEVAVQHLAADRPVGLPHLPRAARRERADARQVHLQRRPHAVGRGGRPHVVPPAIRHVREKNRRQKNRLHRTLASLSERQRKRITVPRGEAERTPRPITQAGHVS